MTINSVLKELWREAFATGEYCYRVKGDEWQKSTAKAKLALLEIIKGAKIKKPDFEGYLMEKHCEQYVGTKDGLIDDFNDWIVDLDTDTLINYANKYRKLGVEAYEKAIEGLFK